MDEEIQSLWDTQEPPRLIHNDLHPWNILIHNEELIPIDFEDLQVGYPIRHRGRLSTWHGMSVALSWLNTLGVVMKS